MNLQHTGFKACVPSSAVTTIALDGFHPAVMEEAFRLGTVEHVQLAPGHFRGRLMRAEQGASRIDWASYNIPLLALGEMPGDRVTLGFVFDISEPCWLNGHEVSAATPVLFTEGTEFHYRSPRGWQGLAVQLPREQAEVAGLELRDQGVTPLAAEPQCARGAEREFAAVLEGLRDIALGIPAISDAAACLRRLESHLLDLFSATAMDTSSSPSARATDPARRAQLVRRATDFMYARLGEPLRVGAICRDIGCDWKTLKRAFLAVNGVPPKRFLTMARLSMARRTLLRAPPDASVTSIALNCGIHHLGPFSCEYRRVFGEVPSETLARATQRV